MNTLTFTPVESVDMECPPEDVYVLQLTDIGEFVEKPAYKQSPTEPDIINTQSRWDFVVTDFDYDEDVDDRDWNGVRVSDYFVFYKLYPNGNKTETWKNEKSNAYALISALIGHAPEKGEDIDLESLLGKKIKATVTPKQSGWPKITKPIPFKQRRKKKEEPVIDDGAFDDDE